jgi:hypothetical protein
LTDGATDADGLKVSQAQSAGKRLGGHGVAHGLAGHDVHLHDVAPEGHGDETVAVGHFREGKRRRPGVGN